MNHPRPGKSSSLEALLVGAKAVRKRRGKRRRMWEELETMPDAIRSHLCVKALAVLATFAIGLATLPAQR